MKLYHAGKDVIEYPEIRITKYTKDFSWGFYCTNIKEQAVRWAKRGNGHGIINEYEYTSNEKLSILRFAEMTDEWLDFIAKCRAGNIHSYDVVEGPMANDTVWNYVNDFVQGTITREQFWVLAKFKYPTHQISFHTLRALECLTYTGSEACDDR